MKQWVLGLLAAGSWASPTSAALIRYDFAGTFETAMPAGAFAAEAGLTGGSGAYSGFILFDSDAPNLGGAAELYLPNEFLLAIGAYSFSSADADLAVASIDPATPSFALNFQSSRDFTPSVGSEFLNFSILFPQALPGLVQDPILAAGIADLTLIGDGNFLFAAGGVTRFDVASAVPEPSSWAMMIGGFAFVGAALRRRSRRPSIMAT